jgi:hypothetical protein
MAFDIYQLDRFAAGEEQAEEALPAYQDALLERFSRSPKGQARSRVDPEIGFWAAQLIDYGHIPPDLVVECVTAQRKPPEVRICRLRNQSAVGTRPPSTSTPHWPACWARRW